MNANTVRMNIAIPEDLAQSLNRVAEPRKRSQFIVEALRQKIKQKEREDLDMLLEEGYKAVSKENLSITEAFEWVDLEGWDEY